MMQPLFSIFTQFDLNAHVKCYRRSHCFKPAAYLLLLIPLVNAIGCFVLWLCWQDNYFLRLALINLVITGTGIALPAVIFGVIYPATVRRETVKKKMRVYGSLQHEKVFHFFPWGFVTKTEKEEFRWNYADLKKIRETDDYIILCFGKAGFQYIDRRDIPNYDEFRQFMQDRLRDGGIKSYRSDNGTPL